MSMVDDTLLLALGANLPSAAGPPTATLSRALVLTQRRLGEIVASSRFFRTPAVPAGSGPDFVNACAALRPRARLAPGAVLAELHAVEAELGRERAARWGPRTIDLDLLAMGERVVPDRETQARWMALDGEGAPPPAPSDPVLPHPRLHERAFVLVPLAEIAPGWTHPVTGRDVVAMRDALPAAERAAVVPFEGSGA